MDVWALSTLGAFAGYVTAGALVGPSYMLIDGAIIIGGVRPCDIYLAVYTIITYCKLFDTFAPDLTNHRPVW